ncbi:MAG: sigma-70 family RNA polymerase sigma factor [Candidatus Zixiibacteriota bacterium]
MKKIREEKACTKVEGSETGPAEQELIRAARGGDKGAFGQLIRGHQKRLFRFVYGLVGSFDQAEDIVQEAFVKAYEALDKFETGRDFYPWLATIARNKALNMIAREERKESLDKIQEQGFDTPTGQADPLDQLLADENQRRFYAALKGLPETYRIVFVMRHFEEMSYDQISEQLKIPPGTVDSRLYRARQLLVEALKDLL